ncbi:fimbrillin family protein [Marseilla massiliensis]|uniref:Leucine-rich repeat protein n=1 Tax=Marseilla massiliensis TaxID=1841864 RepID=A0A938WT46_9BACT|nr:fimbrillin family protein [Marseilla massiliensis]MBM6673535.1 leucine-rich repeat protein [Marseilla massiliensis]
MKISRHILLYMAASLSLLTSCSDDLFNDDGNRHGTDRINLSGEIDQLAVTRVNDSGFCDGDVIGVYIVDYNGNTPGTLLPSGNRGDNVRHTFDESANKWNSAYDIYWKDKHTPIDVYGYYPYGSPESIDAYPFTVERDQSTVSEGGAMGGYEASDFLWGKVENVAPTTNVIRLPMKHRMANARITLVEGTGFASGEWAQTEKNILVANLVREATINLADGTVTPTGGIEKTATVPSNNGNEWRAIVIPQTVQAGTTLFSITVGGTPYKFTKNEDLTYVAGKMNNFTIRVDKKENTGQYTLTLISESITPWENDLVSHDADAREYIIINSTAGHLKDSIIAANKDYTQVKNLKITGRINSQDFYFMRDSMDNLQALNLKEVSVSGGFNDYDYYNYFNTQDSEEEIEGMIPSLAFQYKKSLIRIVLPDKLTGIGYDAFSECDNLTGSIIIPEGTTRIAREAFYGCYSLDGSLSLPSTLEYIGTFAFSNCKFSCELILPNELRYIGNYAFNNGTFYGNLVLPHELEYIGEYAFLNCADITGNLSIPQKIKNISNGTFQGSGFDGTLTLHDGIIAIGSTAFANTNLKGNLILPKDLTTIGISAFDGCNFSGNLIFPKELVTINNNAFVGNTRISGTIEFPESMSTIGANAFDGCTGIEGIVIPAGIENIRSGAFNNCFGIGSIVCKGEMPARVESGAFNGVAKDNFTLEVPESAVAQYQTAPGWNEFKRIAAHHELVCRPSTACAINTEHKQTLIVDAEGEWEVASKPDWCELSQTSGGNKTEVTLTIKSMAKGSGDRTGEIVFKLKNEDYTHTCTVNQYDYEYGENEWLTLQKATRGNNGGINIVILGDGYDAKDISSGDYLTNIKQEVEYFFGIEPYTTYRDYFNVYTAFPLSTETGVGTVNTIRYNRFNTTYTGGVGLTADYDEIFNYALNAPTVTQDNLKQTLIIIVPNSTDYGGITQMWEDGSAIAFCPLSTYGYPLDSRGVIQHEAGGHGFGKLGDEYIYHNAFIDFCNCLCCGHTDEFNNAKNLGWYENLSLTGKMHEVPWSHLIFDNRYSDIVDIFEGGFMHNRGVFRSEQNSCMNNNIPYYSTISRESIVKRIKRYAGETYSYEEFVANDRRDAGTVTRSSSVNGGTLNKYQMPPKIHKGSPLKGRKSRRK